MCKSRYLKAKFGIKTFRFSDYDRDNTNSYVGANMLCLSIIRRSENRQNRHIEFKPLTGIGGILLQAFCDKYKYEIQLIGRIKERKVDYLRLGNIEQHKIQYIASIAGIEL